MGSLFPSSCTCTTKKLGFVLACAEKILIPGVTSPWFSDTLTASMEFEPCAAAAHATVSVTDTKGLINAATDGAGFSEGVTAGKAEHFDIPGASISITTPVDIGKVGVYMDVSLGGNPDKLTLDVSLDICAGTSLGCCSNPKGALSAVCPSVIPIELLKGTFSFGDNVCGAPAKPKAGGIGGAAAGGVIGAIAILGAAGFLYRRKQRKDAEDCDDEDKDRLREDLVVEGGDEHYT
jgi:hypothetical protein